MKNKGRKHLAGIESEVGAMNSKGCLTHITRPISSSLFRDSRLASMSPNGSASGRFDKKKWSKRVRGYFKSQTNTFYNDDKL